MDNNGQRENERHKTDHFKQVHAQWMVPQNQLKDSMRIMALMAERDKALQERNIAFAENKAAVAERDTAIIQRDAAIAERNNALIERDNALSALQFTRNNVRHRSECPTISQGTKTVHHHQPQQHLHRLQQEQQQLSDAHYATREIQAGEAFPMSTSSDGIVKPPKAKRLRNGTKVQDSPAKKTSKSPRNPRKNGIESPNKQVTIAKSADDWRGKFVGEDLNKQAPQLRKHVEWNAQDLGLNQVIFDNSAMAVPVCSCTGNYRQCYKWGDGGWQSSCCTTALSMHPLPALPDKRHGRLSGRKMSGSVFRKLLVRLAADGYDLSMPVDLKDHWAKHGTNRYITIK